MDQSGRAAKAQAGVEYSKYSEAYEYLEGAQSSEYN